MLVRDRLASPRADFQDPADLIQQGLVLDGVSALEQLDVVCLRIHFLGQLCLRVLESLLCPAVLDGFGDLGVHFLRRHDIIGAVDFRETLAFDTGGFAGLEVWIISMGEKEWKVWRHRLRLRDEGLTVFADANFFSVATMAPER